MIDLTKDQIEKIFILAGVKAPVEITSLDVSKALVELEKKLSVGSYTENKLGFANTPTILVVDDLELSIHQLSILLSKSGYNIYIARSADEAVQQFKKNKFDYVLVDLFLPDYSDGLDLIGYISQSEKAVKDGTKLVVISGTDDRNLINQCFVKGANEFIEKSPEWHKNILKFIRQCENKKTNTESDLVTEFINVQKRIIAVTVKNINKPNVLNELEKEIISQANAGFSNIILDLQHIKTMDTQHTALLIASYKACIENKGNLVLCHVSQEIRDMLSYVFLDNIIKIYKDKEAALEYLNF